MRRDMKFCFADDSRRPDPERPGLRHFVTVGGFVMDADHVAEAENSLVQVCADAGLPEGDEFKWSPSRDLWMHSNLHDEERTGFFLRVLEALADADARALAVIRDVDANNAWEGAASPEEDATVMFLERASNQFMAAGDPGLVIVDRPPGNRAAENKFLSNCIDFARDKSTYIDNKTFALTVLSAPSKHVRLLQAADLIAGCTTAFVGGEQVFSPPVFDRIRPMLARDLGRAGGVGLKIHPDYRYANLYHWLLGDDTWMKRMVGVPLPVAGRQYSQHDGFGL